MTQKAKTKIKKKKWFLIVAPKIFREAVLGETTVEEPEQMMGKTIEQSLMNLTGDVKKQNVNIKFIVTQVQNNKGVAEIIGYGLVPSFVKRLVRRRGKKIEMSFSCQTADNKWVRVKPLIITKNLAKGTTCSTIRHLIADTLTKYIKRISYDEMINELISYRLQKTLQDRLKKISPVKVCDIRDMHIEKEGKLMKLVAVPTEIPAEEKDAEKAPQEVEEKEELKEQ